MSGLQLSHQTVADLEAIQVDTGPLALTVIPELGGKVSSLRDQRTGREWLWRHPRLPYQPVAADGSYIRQADTGGWDECFPTVAPCAYPAAPWRGAGLPDHGELWSQMPDVMLREAGETLTLIARWRGRALPYVFERALTLTAGSAVVQVAYTARNLADAPLHFIWCAHPLLAVEPGMTLELPARARFNRWSTTPAGLVPKADLAWPVTVRGLDLSRLPGPEAGLALKLWSDPLPAGEGWAAVCAADGELRLRWDTAHLPQVAVWLNLGAWAGDEGTPYYNLGLEPCVGAQDSLAEAVTERHLNGTLAPRGTRAWALDLELRA